MSDQLNDEELLRKFHSERKSIYAKITTIKQLEQNAIPIASALPVLIELLMDDEGAVVAMALIALSTKGDAVVPHLLELVRSNSDDLVERAFMVLRKMGTGAQCAIPYLLELLNNQKLLRNSLATLGTIGDPVKPYLPVLEDMLARQESIQLLVAPVILQIDPKNKKAREVFTRLARSQNVNSRRAFARSVSLLGNLSTEMSNFLNELLDDSKTEVRNAAALSSLELSRNVKKAIDVVLDIFDSGTPETQEDILISLRVMGKLAKPTLVELKKRSCISKGHIADLLNSTINSLEKSE